MKWLPLPGLIALYFGTAELVEYVTVRSRGALVFPARLGWRLLRWVGLAACIAGIVGRLRGDAGPKDLPLWLYILFFLCWLYWPRTVLVDSAGVSSCSLFGVGRRSIHWGEVSRISSDWQEERLTWGFSTIWTFMGAGITVKSRDGVSIQHGVINSRQGLFLDTLRRHLPRDAFDPGLYDWHP
jgi:hypothetical protein